MSFAWVSHHLLVYVFGCILYAEYRNRMLIMSKTVTLRLNDDTYAKFRAFAESDNRSLSNFIETSALRYISESEYIDEFEMAEIDNNEELQASLKRALNDAKNKKGTLISNV